MSLQLHNTLARSKQPFQPAGKVVQMYTCGPTVYAPAQIGNLRSFVFADLLRRWLEHGHGWAVQQVINITDVEDKIIRDSHATSVAEMQAWTKPFEQKFRDDLTALGVADAAAYPHATEDVPQMINLIERISTNGYAYERDGSVYFDVQQYHRAEGYGKLLKIDFAGFAAGQRVDNDEYAKEAIQDFALWKAVGADQPGWDSPWGRGRPGWHIECSAMVGAELTEPIDIHTGGVDLIFPHHENEIAQTKAATDSDLARFWVHGEHLLVDGQRMGKSLDNYYVLDDLHEHNFAPIDLRMLFVSAHYRSKLNFTWESLAGARASWQRIQEFLMMLSEEQPAGSSDQSAKLLAALEATKQRVHQAMDDDLNSPEALAAVFGLIRTFNAAHRDGTLAEAEATAAHQLMQWLDQVFGVFALAPSPVPEEIRSLVQQRDAARAAGDYAASDRLRDQITKLGWSVEDVASGSRIRKISQ